MLLAVPYLLAASICTTIIGEGGPGWLNLIVLLFVWNALKFIAMGPVSLVLLARVRLAVRRATERATAGHAPGRQMGPLTTSV